MSVADIADSAIAEAAEGRFGNAERIYHSAFRKFESKEMVRVVFQNRFVEAILRAGLEATDGAKKKFDNLVKTAHRLWNPKPAWELICNRIARIACEANKAGKHELVHSIREMMIRSRPQGVHENVAHHMFWKLTKIKVRHLPIPRVNHTTLHEFYA